MNTSSSAGAERLQFCGFCPCPAVLITRQYTCPPIFSGSSGATSDENRVAALGSPRFSSSRASGPVPVPVSVVVAVAVVVVVAVVVAVTGSPPPAAPKISPSEGCPCATACEASPATATATATTILDETTRLGLIGSCSPATPS